MKLSGKGALALLSAQAVSGEGASASSGSESIMTSPSDVYEEGMVQSLGKNVPTKKEVFVMGDQVGVGDYDKILVMGGGDELDIVHRGGGGDRGGICGLDLGVEGNKVGGASGLNCGDGGEYGLSEVEGVGVISSEDANGGGGEGGWMKAFDGWGAANSEGWDIESCEYDVSWMDGVEDLANEGGDDELGIIQGGGDRGVICGLDLGAEGNTVGGARARNCGDGGGGEGGEDGSLKAIGKWGGSSENDVVWMDGVETNKPGFNTSKTAAKEEQNKVAGKKSLTSSILSLFSYKQNKKVKKEGDEGKTLLEGDYGDDNMGEGLTGHKLAGDGSHPLSMLSSYLFQDLSKTTVIDGVVKKKVPGSFGEASSSETLCAMVLFAGADNPQDQASHLRSLLLNESSSLEDECSEGTTSLPVNSNNPFCMTGDNHSLEEEKLPLVMEASKGITVYVGASLNLNDGADHDGNNTNFFLEFSLIMVILMALLYFSLKSSKRNRIIKSKQKMNGCHALAGLAFFFKGHRRLLAVSIFTLGFSLVDIGEALRSSNTKSGLDDALMESFDNVNGEGKLEFKQTDSGEGVLSDKNDPNVMHPNANEAKQEQSAGTLMASFSPNEGMERLRDVSRLLRGSKPEDVDLSMLLEVRDVVKTQMVGMKSVQKQLQVQDREWLLSMIKSSIGDSQAAIDSAKEIEPGLGMELEEAISNINNSDLDDIPTAQLVQMFRPESLDHSIEASEELIDVIDGLFDSPAAADHPHRRLDEEDDFDFGQGQGQGSNFFQPNFNPNFSGDMKKMRRKASQNVWNKVTTALHSDHLGDAHKERYHRRLRSLQAQGKCLPECSIDDEACQCQKLIVAATGMTEYDLGVLMLKGFIETDETSENVGNLTHSANLYDANNNLWVKYNNIQNILDQLQALPVANGGFETGRSNWDNYMDGYTVDTSYKNSGFQSIRIMNGGASQLVSLEAVQGSQVTIKGYSKAVGTSTGLPPEDYSIYADVTYSDGTKSVLIAPFPGGTHDFLPSETSFTVPPDKTVTGLKVYALYRNDPLASGVAYFDDIEVTTSATCFNLLEEYNLGNTRNSLLEEFVTACNPEVQSCRDENNQTYQLTIDEIFESVDANIKLDLTVMYDWLDPEPSASGGCSALMSYASCASFIRDFDRIYFGLGSPEDNPMRLNPNKGLWDDDTLNVFENARFPSDYGRLHTSKGIRSWSGYVFAEESCRNEQVATYTDAGYVGLDFFRGWYDVSGCGKCKDYCRWVGDAGGGLVGTGGDPAFRLTYGGSWWSCALVGSTSEYTWQSHFESWTYPKCSGANAISPLQANGCPYDVGLSNKQSGREFASKCDASIDLLAGFETSIGTIRNIADNIEKFGLSGSCCLDTPATSQYPGQAYDPETMTCQDTGPLHLGISPSACEKADGRWTRGPCLELKECIDAGINDATGSLLKHIKDFEIKDPTNQEQCSDAREGLGFDRDYAPDYEVCLSFEDQLCADTFDQIDEHLEGSDQPQTTTAVVYKPLSFPADPELEFENLESTPVIEKIDKAPQDAIKLSRDALKGTKVVFEKVSVVSNWVQDNIVENEKNACGSIFDPTGNFLQSLCWIAVMIQHEIGSVIKYASLVAQYVLTATITGLELAIESTDGPTYYNEFERFGWIAISLNKINGNIGKQHTQMRDQLQTRHSTVINLVNAYTNCRVELFGYDVTRDVGGDVTSQELLLQADIRLGRTGQYSCECLIYPPGDRGDPDSKCPPVTDDPATRRLLGMSENIRVATIGNPHGEKMLHLITQNEQKTMKELNKILNIVVEQERLILRQEDAIEETMLDIALAIAAIQTKLDMEPTIPKTNVNNDKSKKPKAKKPKAVKDDGRGSIFKRKLLEIGDVGAKACNDEIVGKFDTVEKEIKASRAEMKDKVEKIEGKVEKIEGKVEKIEGKVDMVKNDVTAVKDKVEKIEGKVDAMKEMVTLMMRQNDELIRQNKELIDQNHELTMNA